jgi:hypothetical protein
MHHALSLIPIPPGTNKEEDMDLKGALLMLGCTGGCGTNPDNNFSI